MNLKAHRALLAGIGILVMLIYANDWHFSAPLRQAEPPENRQVARAAAAAGQAAGRQNLQQTAASLCLPEIIRSPRAVIASLGVPVSIPGGLMQGTQLLIAWVSGISLIFFFIALSLYKKIILSRHEHTQTEERYRSIISQASDSILLMDAEGQHVLEANAAFHRMLGYAPEEIAGLTLYDIMTVNRAGVDWHLKQILNNNCRRLGEWVFRKKNGYGIPVELNANILSIGGRQAICMIARDISERKRYERQLIYMANHDTLTDLPSRSLFMDRLQHAIDRQSRTGKTIAVMFIDLDQFKVINDTYGHTVGDGLLKEVGARLEGFSRKSDTIARFGGDEFALMIDDLSSPGDCIGLAQKALAALARPFSIDMIEVYVTASIGITFYPRDSTTPEGLLKNADTAMYCAKDSGRNTYHLFSRELNDRVCERFALEVRLRQALERGEFLLNYQPRIHAGTGKIVGAEALLRWVSADKGVIAPSSFIGLSEETGLIVPIGEWVLRTACAQNKAWQDSGLAALKVSVNISARQFQQQNLAAVVGRVLRETGLPPELLELEITESVLISNPGDVIVTLGELKCMGVSISVDDFGTGYSSLLQLKQLPIDTLKIDKSFIDGISRSKNDETLISMVIQMGHSLGLSVVAEGVETKQQMDYLIENRCNELQGFYFGKPQLPDCLRALVEKDSAGADTDPGMMACSVRAGGGMGLVERV